MLVPISIIGAAILGIKGIYVGNSFVNTLLAYPIFFGGYLSQPFLTHLNNHATKSFIGCGLFVVSLAIIIIIPAFNDWPQMYINGYGNSLFLFVLGAINGSYLVFWLAMVIGERFRKQFEILSKGNILTLGIHSYFVAALHGAGMLNGYLDWGYALLIMLLMLPIINCVKRFMPWMIGWK